jgi:hypothetical protein
VSKLTVILKRAIQPVQKRPHLFGLIAIWGVIGVAIWLVPQNIAIILALLGGAVSLSLYSISSRKDWKGIGLGLATELVGAALLYVLLDVGIDEAEEKRTLILELGSGAPGVAMRAAEKLTDNGWLYDGSLQGAYLGGANLRGANLLWADLSETNLGWADLSGAYLRETNLGWADLSGAYLRETILGGAYLRRADLSGAQLSEARYDVNTEWPEGFDPVEAGAVLVNE